MRTEDLAGGFVISQEHVRKWSWAQVTERGERAESKFPETVEKAVEK